MQEHFQAHLQIDSGIFADCRQPSPLQFSEFVLVVEKSQCLSLAVPIDVEVGLGAVQFLEIGEGEGILSNISSLYGVKWHRGPFVILEQLGKINLLRFDGHAHEIKHEYSLHRKGRSFGKSFVREVEAQSQEREYQNSGRQPIADFSEIAFHAKQLVTEYAPRPQRQRDHRDRRVVPESEREEHASDGKEESQVRPTVLGDHEPAVGCNEGSA